jgi:hypothetical protein
VSESAYSEAMVKKTDLEKSWDRGNGRQTVEGAGTHRRALEEDDRNIPPAGRFPAMSDLYWADGMYSWQIRRSMSPYGITAI